MPNRSRTITIRFYKVEESSISLSALSWYILWVLINTFICWAVVYSVIGHQIPYKRFVLENVALVNLILVAEQCLNSAHIVLHYCSHGTGAVLSSDKLWLAVFQHCLSLFQSYDSSRSDVSAVHCRRGVLVSVLCLCQALPLTQLLLPWKNVTKFLPVLSFIVSINPNPMSELWLGLLGYRLRPLGTVSRALAAVLLVKTFHIHVSGDFLIFELYNCTLAFQFFMLTRIPARNFRYSTSF